MQAREVRIIGLSGPSWMSQTIENRKLRSILFDGFVKSPFNVIPAKAGIQKRLKTLDSVKAQ
jgi:hypothetical protein